jgi:hypothetical protein
MSGETNLSLLLKSIQPILREGEYVFCSIDRHNLPFFMADAIGIFQEAEGTTIILSRNRADADKLNYSSVFCLITLSVHSSLDAVGFLAAIATKLAEQGISVNPFSAYYHDHLFVPASRASEVMDLLKGFSEN